MYFVFLFAVILLFVTSYRIFDCDIMSPPVFLCFFFGGAIIYSLYLYSYWHLYEYGGDTAFIFLSGITSFIIGGWIGKKNKTVITIKQNYDNLSKTYSRLGTIKLNSTNVAGVVLFSFLVFIVFFIYYRTRISSDDILKNIVEYKEGRDENILPGFINIMIKILSALSHIVLFVFINNAIYKSIKIENYFLFIPIIIYCIISLLSANRGNVLMLLMSGLIAWYIIYHRIYGWRKKSTSVFLKKGFKITVVFCFFFWEFMIVTREVNTINALDSFMTYICAYFSGPLASFDLYLRQGGSVCEWWGQETFVALNNNLNSLWGIGHASTRFLEFRSGYGRSVVNIYSAFRRFYHDFGYSGVCSLSLIQGYLTTRLYYHVRRKETKNIIDLSMVVYSFFFYTIPYTLTDDLFYSSNVSISGLMKLIILIVAYYIIFLDARYKDSKQKEEKYQE